MNISRHPRNNEEAPRVCTFEPGLLTKLMKPNTKNPRYAQLELLTVEPRPKNPAAWPTPRGSCSRLRGAVVRASGFVADYLPERLNVVVPRTRHDVE